LFGIKDDFAAFTINLTSTLWANFRRELTEAQREARLIISDIKGYAGGQAVPLVRILTMRKTFGASS
jgi:hypothetical protein